MGTQACPIYHCFCLDPSLLALGTYDTDGTWMKEREAKEGKAMTGALFVLQVELHPWVNMTDVVNWGFKRGIPLQGWSREG